MVTGLIAEFDPLHNGHEYILKRLSLEGGAVVVVLSGSIVQRGGPAFLSKAARTEQALRAGADLVLELPSVYSGASAEKFAVGGAGVLCSTGIVDRLGFGCECNDAGLLSEIAALLMRPDFVNRVRSLMKDGTGYASAREKALREIDSSCSGVIQAPNNILAIEYIKSLKQLKSDIEILPVKRVFAGHNGEAEGGFASSSHIRAFGDVTQAEKYVPADAYKILLREAAAGHTADIARMERAILGALLQKTSEEMSGAADVSEGLENRIFTAVREAASYKALIDRLKTKRYTDSRIRRAVLNIYLCNTDKSRLEQPEYIRVLGFRQTGASLLKKMKDTASVPVITKSSDGNKLSGRAKTVFEAEAAAAAFRAMCCETYTPEENDYRYTPVII